MVLRRLLTRLATARPQLYVVEAPGGALLRALLEDELSQRGWVAACSPAAADALVVAGDLPGPLHAAVELLWSQLPGPRARIDLHDVTDLASALDALPRKLGNADQQRADAAARPRDAAAGWLPDHGDRHGDHDSMAPGGIPLAGADEDRDGLEMDVLVHPLGPLLDRWPGGLELRATLHGDIIGEVDVRWHAPAAAADAPVAPGGRWAACDAVATTLSLAGDESGARQARRLRRAASDQGGQVTRATGLVHRIERWRRWSVLPEECAASLTALLTRAPQDDPPVLGDEELRDLVLGRDLQDVRLLVAAHAPAFRRGAVAGSRRGDNDG